MLSVLVCNNMYRYEHNFGSFYRNPIILETVSIDSKCINTDLIENLFYWNTTTGDNYSTEDWRMPVCNWWPKFAASRKVSTTRGSLDWFYVHVSWHRRQSERQNITDRTHTWPQCLITISEDILTTKIRLQSPIDCTTRHRQQQHWYSVSRMCESVRTITKLVVISWFPPLCLR